MQAARDRGQAQAQHVGDFRVGQALHVGQHVNIPINLGQLGDGLFHKLVGFLIQGLLLGGDGPGANRGGMMAVFQKMIERIVGFALRPLGALAAMGQSRIHRDAVQPGGNARVAPEGVQLAHHLQQHVLGDVLGVGIVAEHAPGQVVHHGRVLVKNLLGSQQPAIFIHVCHCT